MTVHALSSDTSMSVNPVMSSLCGNDSIAYNRDCGYEHMSFMCFHKLFVFVNVIVSHAGSPRTPQNLSSVVSWDESQHEKFRLHTFAA